MIFKILLLAVSIVHASTKGSYGNGQITFNEIRSNELIHTVFVNNGKISTHELSALASLHMALKCKSEFPVVSKLSSVPETGNVITSRSVEYKCQKEPWPEDSTEQSIKKNYEAICNVEKSAMVSSLCSKLKIDQTKPNSSKNGEKS